MSTKVCYSCGMEKELCCFNKNKSKRDGYQEECRDCRSIYRKNWHKKHYTPHPRPRIYSDSGENRSLKLEVFTYYCNGNSPLCANCNFTDIRALTIDHINDDGAEDRKKTGRRGGDPFYRVLKKSGYPSGYQVLCANCNTIKEIDRRANNKLFTRGDNVIK